MRPSLKRNTNQILADSLLVNPHWSPAVPKVTIPSVPPTPTTNRPAGMLNRNPEKKHHFVTVTHHYHSNNMKGPGGYG